MPDFKNKLWIIDDFIQFVQQKKDRSAQYNPDYYYNVYADKNVETLSAGMEVYIGDSIQVTDEDKEVYPPGVLEMGFWIIYSDENLQSVIDLATTQKSTASVEEIIACLNYYDKYDDFLDLN